MALWLNRSGRHCEHEDKFLNDNRKTQRRPSRRDSSKARLDRCCA